MNTETNKEKWINEVMSSAHGIKQAEAPADLFEKITFKINNPQPVKTISFPVKQWAAAAILLLALNIGSVLHFTDQNKKKANNSTTNPLVAEMQLESTYNY